MKRLLLSCVAVTVFASTAFAQAGLKFAFDDCAGAATATWACDVSSNTVAALSAVASFMTPGSTKLVGEEGVMEVSFETAVPAWWRVGSTSVCGRTSASFTVGYIAPGAVCYDYFGSFINPPTGANTYEIGPATGDPTNGPIDANHVRIRTVSAIDGTDPAALVQPPAGSEVFVFSTTWTRRATLTCAGCSQQACLMFKTLKVTQPAGLGDFSFNAPAPSATNILTWNSSGVNCATVPVRSRTWGQIKSLYR